MTSGSALAVAAQEYGKLITRHTYTIEYGSFTESALYDRTTTGRHYIGTLDVWKITVTGVQFERSCGIVPAGVQRACPPPARTLVILVDDKAGKNLEAEAW